MKKLLLLPIAFAALSGAAHSDRKISSNWQIEVQASGRLRFTLRMESDSSRHATHPAFRLQIPVVSPSVRSMILFQIGDRPHA